MHSIPLLEHSIQDSLPLVDSREPHSQEVPKNTKEASPGVIADIKSFPHGKCQSAKREPISHRKEGGPDYRIDNTREQRAAVETRPAS